MDKYYKYRKYKKECFFNLVKNSSIIYIVASFGLFVGGLLFLVYYLYIGFMPSLNSFADFTYLIFLMAIVGLFIFTFLLLLLILPAFFYINVIDYETKKNIDIKLFIYSISIIPTIIIIYLIKEIWLSSFIIYDKVFYILLFIVFLITPLMFNKKLSKQEKLKLINFIFFQSILSYFFILLYIIFIRSKQSNVISNIDFLFTFLVFSVVVILVNALIIDEKFRKQPITSIIIVIFTLIFLMTIFRTYAIVPSYVMNQFQLGNFVINSITSKARSCKTLSSLNGTNFKISSIDSESQTCTIKGEICILSSIGSTMLWQTDANTTISLPSEDFSGMTRNIFDHKKCVIYRH